MDRSQYVGLFDRVGSMLDLVNRFPDNMSNEESDGLVALLPPDVANSIGALLDERMRGPGVAFMKMIAKWHKNAREAHSMGKKSFIMPFNFPPELIHAFEKAEPITSEFLTTLGVVALEGQGERYFDIAMGLGLPDYICSSNTIALGSMLGAEDFQPDGIISAAPGGCDANSKIHEFVSRYLDIPQFFIQKPTDDSKRGHDQYAVYFKKLIETLEEFIGEKLDEDRLRSVLTKVNRCTELHYELFELQKVKPSPLPNLFSLLLYGVRFTTWGTDEGIHTLETMLEWGKARLKNKQFTAEKEVARCLWAYTSFYFDFTRLFNWMGDQGYSHLGDGLDLYFPQPIDTTSMETMIAGMAETAWNMPMTRQVGAEAMSVSWTDDVINTAKDLEADCVIYCGHHSCKQTWSVVSILREELKKRLGLELLVLQGDSWMKTMTPATVIQEQVQEFINNVVAQKEKPKRKVRRRKSAPKKKAT